MPINNSYDEAAIVEAIATALDNFYTNLIKKVDSLNVKTVMKRKNPYLFRAKAMNGAAQIIDAILAAFVSSSEEADSHRCRPGSESIGRMRGHYGGTG